MPTYDLTCSACGHRYDLFVMRMLRDEDRVCPECGSTDVRSGIGGGFLGSGTKTATSGAPCGDPAPACGGSNGRFA